jgi:uncharacterized protein
LNPIVLDTSVLISSALFPGSIPDQAVICAFEAFDVVVSTAMLDELRASLGKPRHAKYASVEARMSFADAFEAEALKISVTTSIVACRDPKDDKVLELAVTAAAPIIISGDKDLLTMSPFRGIEIMSPRQFLDEFS